MPTPFIMPKFDMDQEKAKIVSWEKREGDFVKADEAVLTVETDKVAIEVPAPATGTLAGIRFQAGDVVPVTTVIAYILKEEESLRDLPAEDAPSITQAAPATIETTKGNGKAAPPSSANAVSATPVAMRAAKELGVDLSKVPPSGTRITREDVERYAASRPKPATRKMDGADARRAGRVTVAATPAARRLARELDAPLGSLAGSGPRGRVQAGDVVAFAEKAQAPVVTAFADRPAEVIPLAGMRQAIAERMQASFQETPHIALTVEADMSALEASRARLNELAARDGVGKVTVTALLVKIVGWVLQRHPYLNASLKQGQIHLWKDINVGVAIAVPDGLIVPVIRNANRKSIREIVAALHDLAARAKEGRLDLGDVQHGTFTISNLGMFGIRQFRAIINPPESAILAVGAVVRKPVVIDDQDEVAVRPILALTLSADHRVVDGVGAARFLADLVQAIEMPETLLY
jgi:pyruvate dehydrogenase E2 component (dihydrolipoamide acetyltransferase)